MGNLWRDLPRPIRALAPMEDVTDSVFRRIIASCGRPDVFFTEFTHTDIVLAKRKKWRGITPRLRYTDGEHPLVAQIWGNDPEQYRLAALRLRDMGFDGIDINMGCPVRKIRKKGACSALILQPALAAELIAAAREGGLPVSVKTRIGYDDDRTEEWMSHLLRQRPDALTVHGRTAAQESEGPVNWEAIARTAALRNELSPGTAVFGNGDVLSGTEIVARASRYGLDGVMVGRGVFADPYLFAADGRAGRFAGAPADEKLDLLVRHVELYRDFWGPARNYEVLKKFYKIYLVGFDGADALREALNHTHDYDEALQVVAGWRAAA
jgi:nifR3 family TIM-barrel protein